jgi:hypothetical protein
LLCQLFSACKDYSILRHALLLCMAALLLCKQTWRPKAPCSLKKGSGRFFHVTLARVEKSITALR